MVILFVYVNTEICTLDLLLSGKGTSSSSTDYAKETLICIVSFQTTKALTIRMVSTKTVFLEVQLYAGTADGDVARMVKVCRLDQTASAVQVRTVLVVLGSARGSVTF